MNGVRRRSQAKMIAHIDEIPAIQPDDVPPERLARLVKFSALAADFLQMRSCKRLKADIFESSSNVASAHQIGEAFAKRS
jgi:hypothetical protein